jgi:hypothetical protein
MSAAQYMPFFLTGLFPCLTVLIAMLVNHWENKGLRDEMRTNFSDVKTQIDHLIDLHINHAERIAWLESKAGKS